MAASVVVALVGAGPGAHGQAPPGGQPPLPTGCGAPFAPVWSLLAPSGGYPASGPHVGAGDLSPPNRRIDTDADGVPDVVASLPGGAYEIRRAAGNLTFGPDMGLEDFHRPAFDGDGDGRDDVVPGRWLSAIDFGGPRPVLLVHIASPDGEKVLRVLGDPEVDLTTAGNDVVPPPAAELLDDVRAAAYGNGERVWVAANLLASSGAYLWAWELTDLCAGVVAAEPPAPPVPPAAAPAATPVVAPAAFTG